MRYVEAIETAGGWRGRIYEYDPTGNRRLLVAACEPVRDTKEAAIDDAVELADDREYEYEIDFS